MAEAIPSRRKLRRRRRGSAALLALAAAAGFALGGDDAPPALRTAAADFGPRDPLLYPPSPRPEGAGPYGFERAPAPLGGSVEAFAALFTRLHFELERGAPRRGYAAWAAPIDLRLDPALEAYRPFIARFVAVLRARAEAPIRLLAPGAPPRAEGAAGGEIRLIAAPALEMRRHFGSAACAAFPGAWRWESLTAALDAEAPPRWSEATRLTAASVFLPDRGAPWLMRACLMEELMQALGPAADFYWLTGSIFNDDNVRLSPTALDYLMLRVSFAPELEAGLGPVETEAAARRALARLLPDAPRAGPEPRAFGADERWRERLRLARATRHPTFSSVYFRDAEREADRLAHDDPRRLWTRFEAARDRARSSPAAGRAALDALAAPFAAAQGAESLYAAMLDLERAAARLSVGNVSDADRAEAAALAEAAAARFVAADREDAAASAFEVAAAARLGVAVGGAAAQADPRAAAWRLYAYGARAPRFERIAPPPPRAAQGLAPITLATLLTLGPLLGLVWLLRLIF